MTKKCTIKSMVAYECAAAQSIDLWAANNNLYTSVTVTPVPFWISFNCRWSRVSRKLGR